MTGGAPRPSDAALEARMREAIELARRGRLRVEPNPQVGAIVLDARGERVAAGCHERYGEAHAEAAALAEAGERARGGTLVVTLEPCAHEGKKTPPCLPAVLRSGVARVVVGAADPNPLTAGRARAAFEAAGIAHEDGILAAECDALVARYRRHLAADIPWTIAKWAMSADGRLADRARRSRWITGEESRALVHELRAGVEAVIVGRGTVVGDDPALTSRLPGRRSPLRVVLDSGLRAPLSARVFATARDVPTLVLCSEGADRTRFEAIAALGAEVVMLPGGMGGGVDLPAAFRELRRRGVRRALLEAGGVLSGACLRAGLVHQVAAFVAPLVLGGREAPVPVGGEGWPIESAPRLEEPRVLAVGRDALLEGYWPERAAGAPQ